MMYIHYCHQCRRIFMLNGHRLICPKCTAPLSELQISYLDYVKLDPAHREALCSACADEKTLCTLKTNYRMYKYSKWYRKLQSENADNLPITTLLADRAKSKSH